MIKVNTIILLVFVCGGFYAESLFGQLIPNAQTGQGFTRPGYRNATPRTPQNVPGPSRTVQGTADWRCLLFAAEDYDEKTQNLPPLRGCFNDMTAVQKDWLDRIGVGGDRVVFLNDRHPIARSTQRNFLDRLDELCRKAEAGTNLLVAVSGHGIAVNGKSFICPIDVVYHPSTSTWDNLIPVSAVIDKLKTSKAGRKLLIIDACRTTENTAGKEDFMTEFASLSKDIASTTVRTSGIAVVSSCSLNQEAHEMLVDGQPRGVFMKYFLEGLYGPADYSGVIDGDITLSEAYAYAFAQTSKYVYLCRNRGRQTPELFRDSNLISFTLARSEPSRKRTGETDMQFLLRSGMELATRGLHALSTDVLTHVIAHEPNNNIAVACRAGTFLATSDYPAAMKDCDRLGRTLDLYLCFSPADTSAFQKELDRLRTNREKEDYVRKNRKVRIRAGKDAASEVRAELEPGRKVSISEIDGSWYHVRRIDDDASQNDVGWIHKGNLTWSPEKVEQYRPETMLHSAPADWRDKVGGLNFRQQSGAVGGGTGRGTMQRGIGMGGI